ncbi:MAG: SDR family oxidoreductase [Anaerolineales bacterium]|nr:MAG: SDR family oxidoreductase [Anaerolineales bacterium]
MTSPRHVVITGAAGGIGRACVEHYHQLGWRVWAIDQAQPTPALPDGVTFIGVDLAVAGEVDAVVDQLTQQLGGHLHVLVNNAALQVAKSLAATSADEWDRVHAINLRAPFLLARDLYPALAAARGAVVNVSSVHAFATSADIGAYASSKGGLLALTRAMAIEFAKDGVRANAILPGATDTPMLQAGLDRGHVQGADMQQRKADLAGKILLKRLATPEEIARSIYFLGDGEASGYITGQSLVVDGGALARLSTE